jgi:uncharacterized membrane-anchored protein
MSTGQSTCCKINYATVMYCQEGYVAFRIMTAPQTANIQQNICYSICCAVCGIKYCG